MPSTAVECVWSTNLCGMKACSSVSTDGLGADRIDAGWRAAALTMSSSDRASSVRSFFECLEPHRGQAGAARSRPCPSPSPSRRGRRCPRRAGPSSGSSPRCCRRHAAPAWDRGRAAAWCRRARQDRAAMPTAWYFSQRRLRVAIDPRAFHLVSPRAVIAARRRHIMLDPAKWTPLRKKSASLRPPALAARLGRFLAALGNRGRRRRGGRRRGRCVRACASKSGRGLAHGRAAARRLGFAGASGAGAASAGAGGRTSSRGDDRRRAYLVPGGPTRHRRRRVRTNRPQPRSSRGASSPFASRAVSPLPSRSRRLRRPPRRPRRRRLRSPFSWRSSSRAAPACAGISAGSAP